MPAPVHDSQAEDVDVSDEDVEFVQQQGKRLKFLADLNEKDLNESLNSKQRPNMESKGQTSALMDDIQNTGEDDGEEDYERVPRVAKTEEKVKVRGLPVKTLTGEIQFEPSNNRQLASEVPIQVAGVAIQDDFEERLREQKKKEEEDRKEKEKAKKEKGSPQAKKDAQVKALQQDPVARRHQLKQEMAVAAMKLLQSPEGHISELKVLGQLCVDQDHVVARLAMVTLMKVYQDILPGYRIRPPTEKELQVRVSKDVQRVRDYETALLKNYQQYLKALWQAADSVNKVKVNKVNKLAHARVAMRCLCHLLCHVSHFNYTSDILRAVVPRTCHVDPGISDLCVSTLREVLRGDVGGRVALEVVQLVADLVRQRKCLCPPRVVQCLAVLRFTEVPPPSKDNEQNKGHKKKKKRRKKTESEVEAEKDYREGEAGPDLEELALVQSKMLEGLFEIYFRVLKHCAGATTTQKGPLSPAKSSRRFPLLLPTLSGIAKYGHLISVDYFNDLTAVIQQLLGGCVLPLVARLMSLLTICDLLRGQGEALNVDRKQFYVELYRMLEEVHVQPLAEEERWQGQGGFANNTMGGAPGDLGTSLPDESGDDQKGPQEPGDFPVPSSLLFAPGGPSQEEAVQESVSVMTLRALEVMLLQVKVTDMARLAAFVKRMMALALVGPASLTLGLLALNLRLIKRYPRLLGLLDWEGEAPVGGRMYQPSCPDPTEAGALATSLWELFLMASHCHPHVRAAAQNVLALSPTRSVVKVGATGGGLIAGVQSPSEVATSLMLQHEGLGPDLGGAPPRLQMARRKGPTGGPEYSEEFMDLMRTPDAPLDLSSGPRWQQFVCEVEGRLQERVARVRQRRLLLSARRSYALEAHKLHLFQQHLKRTEDDKKRKNKQPRQPLGQKAKKGGSRS